MFDLFTRRSPVERNKVPPDKGFETSYLESLATEKTASLAELQNATTWGLTIITTGTLFILGRSQFPDFLSLLGLLVLTVLATHFTTRAAKGYINVVRWSLIQRTLLAALADGSKNSSAFQQALRTYHLGWSLPLRRRDVIWKALVELGFGYIFVLLVGAVVYCLVVLHPGLRHFLALAAAVLLIFFDLVVFANSPYMQRPVPHAEARRLR
ncbi:hypothetical protein [Micromonospora sediminicola]|uniref:hypothetical protein n=1 Tax=Micromonospora sediminicola TaxID=946078 RepID=UPI00378D2EC0